MENSGLIKIKNFIINNKLICILLLSTIFIFLSTFWYPLIFASAVILVVGIVFLDFEDILCLFLYMAMFGAFLVPFIASIAAGFIVIVIKYVVDVKKKRVEFLKLPLIVTTVISILFSLIHYEVNDLGLYQGVEMIAFLYFIYFAIVYREKLNVKKLFDYLFFGLIVSVVFSAFVYILPNTTTLSFDNGNYIYASMKSKVAFDDGEYVRLVLTTFHVNHLAAFCLFAMAYAAIVVLTKKQKTKKEIIYYLIMYIANLAVGFLTLSKAFMVVFAFEVFVLLVYYIIKHKKKALKIIAIGLGLLVVFCLLFGQRLDSILERFFVYNYDTILGMLTTGRSAIWQQYVNAVLESPLKLLFGFGLFSAEQLLIGPHNFYIFILYRFGIIGILMLAYLVYCYVKSVKMKPNFSIRLSLILLTFLVIGLQEACVDERFFFFIIGLILMCFSPKKNQVEKTTKDQAQDETIQVNDKISN